MPTGVRIASCYFTVSNTSSWPQLTVVTNDSNDEHGLVSVKIQRELVDLMGAECCKYMLQEHSRLHDLYVQEGCVALKGNASNHRAQQER